MITFAVTPYTPPAQQSALPWHHNPTLPPKWNMGNQRINVTNQSELDQFLALSPIKAGDLITMSIDRVVQMPAIVMVMAVNRNFFTVEVSNGIPRPFLIVPLGQYSSQATRYVRWDNHFGYRHLTNAEEASMIGGLEEYAAVRDNCIKWANEYLAPKTLQDFQ